MDMVKRIQVIKVIEMMERNKLFAERLGLKNKSSYVLDKPIVNKKSYHKFDEMMI